MKNGMYRNRLGAVLHVTGFALKPGGLCTLGDTYYAESRDPLFGTTPYVVTGTSMTDCGYELVEEATL